MADDDSMKQEGYRVMPSQTNVYENDKFYGDDQNIPLPQKFNQDGFINEARRNGFAKKP